MDHMVTVTMVPDALALEKGIGWVWLQTDLPPLGWDGLNCTICSLFVNCVLHCLLIVCLSVSGSLCKLFLFALPVVLALFLFSFVCLARFWFIAGFWEIFHYGLLLITFIPKTEPIVHVNCITKLKRMPWHMYLLFVTLFCNTIDEDRLQPNAELNQNCSVWLMWDLNYVVSLQVFGSLEESVACEQCSTISFLFWFCRKRHIERRNIFLAFPCHGSKLVACVWTMM